MSEKKISYLSRTFDDYKQSLKEYIAKYYPNILNTLDDASIGNWIIDIVSAIGDNLSFHIDRVYGETTIDSAAQTNSVYALARSNGFKIPGPKASIAEEKITCQLPVYNIPNGNGNYGLLNPDWRFAPVIKRGTKISSENQVFEIMEDVDFKEQFNSDGYSDRVIHPNTDANGKIYSYTVSKYTTVSAGESKVFRKIISSNEVKPFMEIVIPETDIMNIESIILKEGSAYLTDPSMSEFMNPNEYVPAMDSPYGVDTYRFFEVNSLTEQYRWGDDISNTRYGNQNIGRSVSYEYGYQIDDKILPVHSITKGEWIPLTQKFITEYTDNGYLKIIFGSGEQIGQTSDYSDAKDISKYQISKMIRNNFLGKLPRAGFSIFILYRVGGGKASNVAKDTIKNIEYLDATVGTCIGTKNDIAMASSIRDNITFTNTTPSISGKDAPTIDEIKAMIKYNNSSQERCVTLKDYENRILAMPPRYGCPFRIRAIEENNKIMLYLLGIDYNGLLSDEIADQLIKNINNYLSMYRSINDFIEIKVGRVINVSFEVDLFIDKNYDSGDVVINAINTIKDYMDVNKHELGEDIYVGDIEKEISKIDGVLNLIDLRVYNEFGENYSPTRTSQDTYSYEEHDDMFDINKPHTVGSDAYEINLETSDYILNSEPDEMFEIRFPERDIRVRFKTR